MAVVASYSPKLSCTSKIPLPTRFSCLSHPKSTAPATPTQAAPPKLVISDIFRSPKTRAALLGVGLLLTFTESASSMELPLLGSALQLDEPSNALSLPTWTVHVSSVIEWIIAMALVWQYGERSGYESWKGLSWGMVPLLGGALCACTWHFFYNSESLEVLVALQAALTVLGNATMCIAAYRIYKSREGTKNF
ncbi:uncharacterized protein LOC114721117 [Neltuma alba]|uniref:uncharacterized protein LOC114721117 n=1 Tax=Neltuma alba TaxID=207710 RepID=UPI0010A3AB67|nr:uncharacterized protein LOC114721117 [Prosopis alba]